MSNRNLSKKKFFTVAGIGVVGLFILMQLIPISHDNPATTQEVQWNSAETRALAQRACFDCHSNETVWPAYSYVAPISWIISSHVHEGRQHLNFSEWDRPNEDQQRIIETITSGQMPMWDYLSMHPEANLTEAETQALIDGLKQTLTNDPPIERRRRRPPGG
jgi:cytochrome c551/c552